MILVRKGDLFEGGHEAYARGVCRTPAAERGLALKFKSLYPDMEDQYRTLCAEGEVSVGDVFCFEASDDRPTVFNLVVQEDPDRVLCSAFETAIEKMYRLMHSKDLTDVGMPKIGGGQGSLSEEQFFEGLDVIKKDSRRHVTVYEYTP